MRQQSRNIETFFLQVRYLDRYFSCIERGMIMGEGKRGGRRGQTYSRASLNESGSFVHLNPAIVGPPVEFVNHK